MQEFFLILKHDKLVAYKKSIVAIIGLNLIFFISYAIITGESKAVNSCIFLTGTTLFLFIAEYFLTKKGKKVFSAAIAVIALIIYMYIKIHAWWAAIAMILILFLYLAAIQIQVVQVTETGVAFGTFSKRIVKWHQLNNLVLKDGLLTIDFKNNKIIQQLIDDKSPSVNEQEFNDFCRAQIKKATLTA